MAITFDKDKTATANNVTSLSIPIGITNVAEPAVICAFGDNVNGRTFSSMQFGGTSLSRIAVISISSNQRLAVGVLSAGAFAGLTGTAVVGFGGGLNVGGVVACFVGVKQSNPSGANAAVSRTSTATFSVNFASTLGGMLIFCDHHRAGAFSFSGGTVVGSAFYSGASAVVDMWFMSAVAATVNGNAHNAGAGNKLGIWVALTATAVSSVGPSTAFIGGLGMMGCGLRIRWTLDDLFPPPLIPDAI